MLKYFLIPLFFIAVFASCDKDPSRIGDNMQPGSDQADLYQTELGVITHTLLDDNIASNQRSLSPLGELKDQVFGNTKAMFTTQALLSSSNVDFSDIFQSVNSMKLNLRVPGFYGDTTGVKTIRAFRIDKDLFRDSTYYSGFRIEESKLNLLSETEFTIGEDSIISIELPQSLIDEFISESNATYFTDNETFLNFFKGIYVEVETSLNPGFILYIDLVHSSSCIELFYDETESYIFPITSSSTIINQFEHDYSTAEINLQTALEDTTIAGDYCYIQSLGGLKTKIFFPELFDVFDEQSIIGINKAQLIINVKHDVLSEKMPAPPNLNLIAITEDGKSEFLTDFKVNGSRFGGNLDQTYYQYVFNIPLHLQELINGRTDYGLYLLAANNRIYANRAVLYGGNHPELAMKVKILYSKY